MVRTSPTRRQEKPSIMSSVDVDSLNIVRDSLRAYADRGVFRGFSEMISPAGLTIFRFDWLIPRPLELSLDTTTQVLQFKRLLPGIPAGSPLYADLKDFLKQRHDSAVPEHRRIDPHRAEASCTTRAGTVSISLVVKDGNHAYGVNRIVNLIHELFVYLRDAHPGYLVENFDAAQE